VRAKRWGNAIGVIGLGATLFTAALALGGVKVSSFLLWVMGGAGVLLMCVGLVIALLPHQPTDAGRDQVNMDTDRRHLADTLAAEIAQGDKIREELQQEVNHNPFTTAEVAEAPIDAALRWALRNEDTLRERAPEWLHQFRMTAYTIPDEPEPDEITVADAEHMLSARLSLLGEIVRYLRRRPEPAR